MARRHWRKPDYWRWFWRKRVAPEFKVVAGAVLVALTLGGGWLAANRLARAGAGGTEGGVLTIETTVRKLVTVREKGQVVRKLVPVLKTVPVLKKVFVKRPAAVKTTTDVRTVTVDQGVRTVQVRVVSRKTTTVTAKPGTVVRTRLVPVTTTETQTNTLTQSRTVTLVQTSTLMETQTIIQPVTTTQTVTVNQKKPVTVTVTVTVST